jgi:nucleotide-binding universal stress UspA family protein
MYDRLLVPLDGSDLAERSIPHAIEFARRFGAMVSLLEVITPIVATVEVDPAMVAYQQVMEAETEVAEGYIKKTVERFRSEGIEVDGETLVGSPGMTIVDYAHKVGATLIVMATHGRSGLPRFFLGGVANYVLREAGVPVLLVRVFPQEKTAPADNQAAREPIEPASKKHIPL